jgi:hypothetical protein
LVLHPVPAFGGTISLVAEAQTPQPVSPSNVSAHAYRSSPCAPASRDLVRFELLPTDRQRHTNQVFVVVTDDCERVDKLLKVR